ncbi:MAG: ribokinase [Alphaproteobacteria bacterium]|nr:ribokinase [Alphaproteobacteria bacterium]
MITVLGSINMDLVATVDRLPSSGETVAGRNFATAAGGKGANQALAARRAGAHVLFRGAVGTDNFAEAALHLLRDAGSDLSGVRTVDGPTGTALIMVDAHGENIIAVVPGANGAVNESDAAEAIAAMSAGDHLLLQLEVPSKAIDAALKAARAAGVVSVINIAPLTDDAAALAAQGDIVVANETEFERLADRPLQDHEERKDELMRLHGLSGQTLIVTLGADGVIAAHDGAFTSVQGLAIEPVDTVGAGDTFCGYLAAGLDAGLIFKTALQRAAVAGSLACLTAGAQPSIPTAKAVDQALG